MNTGDYVKLILVIFTAIIVGYLIASYLASDKKVEGMSNEIVIHPAEEELVMNEPESVQDDDETEYEEVQPVSTPIESVGCPVAETERQHKEYLKGLYGLREMTEGEMADNELCNFVDFRNKINASSEQMELDAVDKVNMLYLSGNDDTARRHEGKTINEIYNGLTSHKNFVERNGTRLPDFENTCNTTMAKSEIEAHNSMSSEHGLWM